MATIVDGYTQTVVTAPTAPSTTSVFDYDIQFPFYREIFANNIIDEPKMEMELSSARSFFTGESMIDASALLGYLKFGQELTVFIKKDQNPFSLFQKKQLQYEAIDACHDHLVLDCEVPCINTLPTFEKLKFRFDCEYAYGVRMCDKNKDFWDVSLFTQQYALSRRAMEFGREVDLWNTVLDGLRAAPATTVDAFLAQTHPTHFWENGGTVTANARCLVPQAYQYLVDSYANINPTIFVTKEFVTELIASVETQYGNLNLVNQRVNTYERWVLPGFRLATRVQEILGLNATVVILERSPWLTVGAGGSGAGGLQTQYPLWNDDGTKQYVAILDPRVGYDFEKDGYHLNIKPYDCDKLYVGMVDTVYVGMGITFPQFGLLIEFDQYSPC